MATETLRPAGQTLGLSVVAASHTAVALTVNSNDIATFAACLNTGAVEVAIKFSQGGLSATLPGDGTTGDYVLPARMINPLVLPIPTLTPFVTAIGAGAGPSLVYVTPISVMS